MGVASGCGEQEADVASGSGWNLWVWCKEVYRFAHTTYPYSSCICSFLQQHPYFLFILLNVFRSCYIEERRRRMPNHDFFYFVRFVCKLRYYI